MQLLVVVAFSLLLGNAAGQGRVIWRTTASNITSSCFATNVYGLTMAVTVENTTQFYALDERAQLMKPVWSFSPPPHPGAAEHVVSYGARHIEKDDPSGGYNLTSTTIDAVVAADYDGPNESVEFYGVYTNASSTERVAQWHYTVAGGFEESTVDGVPLNALSDDGNITVSIISTGIWVFLHAIHVQLGQPLSLCYLRIGPRNPLALAHSLSISRDGTIVAVSMGRQILFYNTVTCGTFAPTITAAQPFTAPIIICPMGVFLVFGSAIANIYAYNSTARAYRPYFTVGNTTDGFTLQRAAIAVNGGPTNPFGCVVTLGFHRNDGAQLRVAMHSLLTKKPFWVWLSPVLASGRTAVTDIVAHNDYAAVSTRGGPAAAIPNVLLFSCRTSGPVYSQSSRSAMLGVDIVVLHPTAIYITAYGLLDAASISAGSVVEVHGVNVTAPDKMGS